MFYIYNIDKNGLLLRFATFNADKNNYGEINDGFTTGFPVIFSIDGFNIYAIEGENLMQCSIESPETYGTQLIFKEKIPNITPDVKIEDMAVWNKHFYMIKEGNLYHTTLNKDNGFEKNIIRIKDYHLNGKTRISIDNYHLYVLNIPDIVENPNSMNGKIYVSRLDENGMPLDDLFQNELQDGMSDGDFSVTYGCLFCINHKDDKVEYKLLNSPTNAKTSWREVTTTGWIDRSIEVTYSPHMLFQQLIYNDEAKTNKPLRINLYSSNTLNSNLSMKHIAEETIFPENKLQNDTDKNVYVRNYGGPIEVIKPHTPGHGNWDVSCSPLKPNTTNKFPTGSNITHHSDGSTTVSISHLSPAQQIVQVANYALNQMSSDNSDKYGPDNINLSQDKRELLEKCNEQENGGNPHDSPEATKPWELDKGFEIYEDHWLSNIA